MAPKLPAWRHPSMAPMHIRVDGKRVRAATPKGHAPTEDLTDLPAQERMMDHPHYKIRWDWDPSPQVRRPKR